MNLHRISYPFAIYTETRKIVHASEVPNGLECKCHCYFCREPLIAVNSEGNKRKAHFRHKADTKCKADYETFIHWISKYAIRTLEKFTLPSIDTRSISSEKDFQDKRSAILEKHGLPQYILSQHNDEIQPEKAIQIERCEEEVPFKTNLGLIKSDIVVYHEGSQLLIEPYYTNPIDEDKRKKLIDLNKSTISIDLSLFVKKNESLFTLEDFAAFLGDTTSAKRWVVIRKEKIGKLKEDYLQALDRRLSLKAEEIGQYKKLERDVAILRSEIKVHHRDIQRLDDEIAVVESKKAQIEASLVAGKPALV